MQTTEIKSTMSYLTINNHTLSHNFTFKVVRSSNFLSTFADIFIKQSYYLADKMEVNVGDTVVISLQNNDASKVDIFTGIVRSITSTAGEINLTADRRVVEDETFNETYNDTTLQKILSELITDLKFEADNPTYTQIVFRGKKSESLNRLLKDKHFFVDLEDYFVIRDTATKGNTYTVDNCLCSAKLNTVSILPVPQIDIDDVIVYQEQSYIIYHIVYDYQHKALMTLWLKPYSE